MEHHSLYNNIVSLGQTAISPPYSGTMSPVIAVQPRETNNNTHAGNCFTGLCTDQCTGYNNNSVVATQNSGTSGVVVNSFNRMSTRYTLLCGYTLRYDAICIAI